MPNPFDYADPPSTQCANMSDAELAAELLGFVAELQRAINELVRALDVPIPELEPDDQ